MKAMEHAFLPIIEANQANQANRKGKLKSW
jgi:hypothetical protein